MPQSAKTRGHRTHTLAAVWKKRLVELLKESEHWQTRTHWPTSQGEPP
jgi:hypothetical protein